MDDGERTVVRMAAVRAGLIGGLGNQMFIAAAAADLANRLGTPYTLFPISGSTHHHGRASALDLYPALADHVAVRRRRYLPLAVQRRADRCIPGVFRESGFFYDERYASIARPVRLSGYFQSPKYFSTIDAQHLFRIDAENPRLEQIRAEVGTKFRAVHIRLGDYANLNASGYHGVCSNRYFAQALQALGELGHDEPTVIFTNQPELVPDELRPNAQLILGPERGIHEALELDAMANASALVISNSSFSWWAAFLGEREGRPVIAPRPWLLRNDTAGSDLLLPSWLTIGAR